MPLFTVLWQGFVNPTSRFLSWLIAMCIILSGLPTELFHLF